jgi:hypothetical protein
MALETLKGVTEIGGFKVAEHFPIGKETVAYTKNDQFVTVNHIENSILFEIQDGPIKENGVNGCQVDTLIHAAIAILLGLNEKFPCDENHSAIDYLGDALRELNNRTKGREKRGVEGTSEV